MDSAVHGTDGETGAEVAPAEDLLTSPDDAPAIRLINGLIAEAARLHLKIDRSAAHAHARRMLELVEIPAAAQRVNEYPHQLSGGMRQRHSHGAERACCCGFADVQPRVSGDLVRFHRRGLQWRRCGPCNADGLSLRSGRSLAGPCTGKSVWARSRRRCATATPGVDERMRWCASQTAADLSAAFPARMH